MQGCADRRGSHSAEHHPCDQALSIDFQIGHNGSLLDAFSILRPRRCDHPYFGQELLIALSFLPIVSFVLRLAEISSSGYGVKALVSLIVCVALHSMSVTIGSSSSNSPTASCSTESTLPVFIPLKILSRHLPPVSRSISIVQFLRLPPEPPP